MHTFGYNISSFICYCVIAKKRKHETKSHGKKEEQKKIDERTNEKSVYACQPAYLPTRECRNKYPKQIGQWELNDAPCEQC